MKKVDGSDYKESVVKVMWNSTAKQLQEFYFEHYNVKFDPFKDIIFKKARDAKVAKRKSLQMLSDKRKISCGILSENEFQKIVDMWDEETPTGLQRKFFHIVSLELCWRGGEGSTCKVNYFREELDNAGVPTGRVEYNPLFSKTSQGGEKKLTESKWLTSNLESPSRCPVRLYKKLTKKRPETITTDRFFLTPNPTYRSATSKRWYKNTPIGKNEMAKWLKQDAEKVGVDTKGHKISNHSIRATAVSHLAKAGIGEQQLIKISGQASANSIKPYIKLDPIHHKKIIQALRPTAPESSASAQESSVVTHTHQLNQDLNNHSVVYNNCTIINHNYYYSNNH